MSELAVTLLRLSYLVLLWLFVLFSLGVLRRDIFGTTVTTRGRGQAARRPARSPKPARQQVSPRSRAAAPPTRLIVTQGPLTGSAVPLGSSAVIVGRASSCTLVLDDHYSSNRHARFFPHEGRWYVEDLDSTNGTFVDGERVFQARPVAPGVPVRIGQSTMELRR
ncbi:MAG: FHA domain-containing protein [Bowdeniella nasicola]|nr:FHA domain-containing protein [Bowdeniella nasicola]